MIKIIIVNINKLGIDGCGESSSAYKNNIKKLGTKERSRTEPLRLIYRTGKQSASHSRLRADLTISVATNKTSFFLGHDLRGAGYKTQLLLVGKIVRAQNPIIYTHVRLTAKQTYTMLSPNGARSN